MKRYVNITLDYEEGTPPESDDILGAALDMSDNLGAPEGVEIVVRDRNRVLAHHTANAYWPKDP